MKGLQRGGIVLDSRQSLSLGELRVDVGSTTENVTGFAYDAFGDGKTAVRGGFGVFYERIRQNFNRFDGLGIRRSATRPRFSDRGLTI